MKYFNLERKRVIPSNEKIKTEDTKTGSVDIELIPYYAWANRGLAYMDVWIPLAR